MIGTPSALAPHGPLTVPVVSPISIGLVLSSARPRVESGLFSPAVGPLFSPAVGPLFSTRCGSALFYSSSLWCSSKLVGLLVVLVCPSHRARRPLSWRTVGLCAACSLTCCAWFAGLTSLLARRRPAQVVGLSVDASTLLLFCYGLWVALRLKRSSRLAHGCLREPHHGFLSLSLVPSSSSGNCSFLGLRDHRLLLDDRFRSAPSPQCS